MFFLSRRATDRMVRQELSMSCGAACARQLLHGEGVSRSEAELRTAAKFSPETGIDAKNLAAALNELGSARAYRGGAFDYEPEQLLVLMKRVPWLALLRFGRASHWVIVDGLDAEVFKLRDPAGDGDSPCGAEATVAREAFLDAWRMAVHGFVYPTQSLPR